MEDVKRIAKDINSRLSGGNALGDEKVQKEPGDEGGVDFNVDSRGDGKNGPSEREVKKNDNVVEEASSQEQENVSIQAVVQ